MDAVEPSLEDSIERHSISRFDPMQAHKREVRFLRIALMGLLLACITVAGCVALVTWRPDLVARVMGTESTDVRMARKLVEDRPRDSQAHTQLGYALQVQGRLDEAIVAYGEAIALDSRNLGALYNRARCHLAQGDETAAARDLRAVLAISDVHALAAYDLGSLYVRSGRATEAVDVVLPAAQVNPGMADLQALLGSAYERSGTRDNAIAAYRSALQLDPAMKEAIEGLQRLGVDGE